MRAVDTNVLVHLVVRDDLHQLSVVESFIEPGAWVPVIALAEAIWVAASFYGRNNADIADAIALLLNHRSLVLQDADAVEAALELFRAKPRLGFSDCLMLHLAKKAGHLPLGTFDRDLAKVEGAQKL